MQSNTSKFRELKGSTVLLRFHKDTDLTKLQDLLNHTETMWGLAKYFKTDHWTLEMVKQRYDAFRSRQNEGNGLTHCVVLNQDGSETVVGDCGFKNIDFETKKAEWGIILHKSVWGTGIAQQCLLLCLDYAFGELGLKTIYFVNSDHNLMSKRFLEKSGIPFLRMSAEGDRYYELTKDQWSVLRETILQKR
jgi:RimJ/RimL family protein N-acetyltransferase